MFNKKKHIKKIEFLCCYDELDSDVLPHPNRSNKHLPKWFRKLSPESPIGKYDSGTAKRCVPVLDAMSQGFIIPLWADLVVRISRMVDCYNASGVKIAEIMYNSDDFSMLIGSKISGYIPLDVLKSTNIDPNEAISFATRQKSNPVISMELAGSELSRHDKSQVKGCNFLNLRFGKEIYKFNNPWIIKTPPNWSVQIKNPSNSFETNIHCLEGVVDTDEYGININLPFIWTGSEEGEFIIERGTPLVQVIPFERTELELYVGDADKNKVAKEIKKFGGFFVDRYRRRYWSKRKKEN